MCNRVPDSFARLNSSDISYLQQRNTARSLEFLMSKCYCSEALSPKPKPFVTLSFSKERACSKLMSLFEIEEECYLLVNRQTLSL